jgi:hypothetical protein
MITAAVFLHGCSEQDDIDAETAAILKEVPLGTAFNEVTGAMQRLGFACRETRSELACEREQRHWLVCIRRTRVILLPLDGRLSNVLVNVGRFC